MPSLIDENSIDTASTITSQQQEDTSHTETKPTTTTKNNYYYYLDSSMRPHFNNNCQTNSPTDTTKKLSNNHNQLNCIDLDLYDYLIRKCKLSTFTLWNLTSSTTTTPLSSSTSFKISIKTISLFL